MSWLQNSSARRDIGTGRLVLVAGLLVCSVIMPEFFFSEAGVSNYGVYARTVVPYSVALLGAALLTWRATRKLSGQGDNSELVLGLCIYAILLVLMMLSTYPYQLSPILDGVHRLIGTVLMLWMLGFGWWLVQRHPSRASCVMFAGAFVGSLVSYLSVVGLLWSLFAGQVMAVAAFGALVTHTIARVELSG